MGGDFLSLWRVNSAVNMHRKNTASHGTEIRGRPLIQPRTTLRVSTTNAFAVTPAARLQLSGGRRIVAYVEGRGLSDCRSDGVPVDVRRWLDLPAMLLRNAGTTGL
jgi:hypothetical protein